MLLDGSQVLIHCVKQTLVYLLLHVYITAVQDAIFVFFCLCTQTDVRQMLFVIVLSAVLNQTALARLIIDCLDFLFFQKNCSQSTMEWYYTVQNTSYYLMDQLTYFQ